MFFLKRLNSNKTNIIKGLYCAVFFSAFIYLEHFGLQNRVVNSFLAVVALYFLLSLPRKAMFFAGFFIGVFWFYWVSFSFIYYELTYLMPLIILGFGLGYGIIFYLFSFFQNLYFRVASFFALSYISIFGFNWLQIELLFLHSYFDIEKIDLLIILVSLALFIQFKWPALLLLILALNLNFSSSSYEKQNHLNIYMPQINLSQDEKWNRSYQKTIISKNLEAIEYAIENGYDLVILPETAFPLVLNTNKDLWETLEEKAQYIDIVTGALNKEGQDYYNSTYHFSSHGVTIANKVVLVPFGEEIPLPKFLRDFINNTFYNGAKDYSKATSPTDFEIQGVKFRNAICYETTTHKIFEDLGDTAFMISISNNAWFTPSIEPTLQKLLMQYYAKLYSVTIYASTNGSTNLIVGK
ncbi:MAG: apolipoprotein N-acyltransferase [Arcobacteraceae bacterium]